MANNNSFNLGQEVSIDLIGPNGQIIDLGGLIEFTAEPINNVVSSKQLTRGGRVSRRVTHDGWKGSFKFDRNSDAMDVIQNLAEANYFAGQPDTLFRITQTVPTPKSDVVRQYLFNNCVVYMKDGGTIKADDKVMQTMEFMAESRVQIV